MPVVQHAVREILLKIVYYGPGLGGKTTNLRHLHANTRVDLRGKLLSLDTETERTLFFDFMPVHLGQYKGYTIRLHLCTVPGQIAYDKTRRLVLRNVDGVVVVVDSQRAALDLNFDSIRNLEETLLLQGDDVNVLPLGSGCPSATTAADPPGTSTRARRARWRACAPPGAAQGPRRATGTAS